MYTSLQERIAGRIKVTEDEDNSSEVVHFRLNKRWDDGINIFGPVSLIGYEGAVRCLDINSESDDVSATESAFTLTHLFRFGQILDLSNILS